MNRKIHFFALILLISIPMIQIFYPVVKIKWLQGNYSRAKSPVLSIPNWFDGSFQEKAEPYINDNFLYRNRLVILNNQIKYALFHVFQNKRVVEIKDQHLLSLQFLKSHLGEDYIGKEKTQSNLKLLQKVKSTLKSKFDVDLVFAISPSKASVLPELIPAYLYVNKKKSNYEEFKEQADKMGIDFIDVNEWFLEMKSDPNIKFPLFPQRGSHYSLFAGIHVLDSIIHHFEKIRSIDIPDLTLEPIEWKDPQRFDRDLELTLNLIQKLPARKLPYPNLSFDEEGKTKPKVLVVGDSYYGILRDFYAFTNNVFDNSELWYYYHQIKPPRENGITEVKEVDRLAWVKQQDIVLIYVNVSNVNSFPWYFLKNIEKSLQDSLEL